jgi:hypothetical protein
MARKLLIGLAVAFIAWIMVANNLRSFAAAPAAWSMPKVFAGGGLTVVYPRAWHARMDGNVLLLWSGSRPPALSTGRAHPVPDGDTWIWLIRLGHPARTNGFPARPDHFELRTGDKAFQSCGFGFQGWNLTFTDGGHTVQAIVGLGRGAAKADVTQVLDRLGVAG